MRSEKDKEQVPIMKNITLHFLAIAMISNLAFSLSASRSLAAEKPTLAILPIRNVNKDKSLAYIGEGIAESLYAADGLVKHFVLVERMRLDRLFKEQKFSHSDYTEKDKSIEMGKMLGARWLLLGSYFTWNNRLRIIVKIVDTTTGTIDPSSFILVEGRAEALLEAVMSIVTKVDRWYTSFKDRTVLASSVEKLSIAVPLFKNINRSSDMDPVSLATAEYIQLALADRYEVLLLERMQIDRIIEELRFASLQQPNPATSPEMGRLAVADLLLLGSFMSFGGKIQFNVRFTSPETGAVGIISPAMITGSTVSLFDLQQQLVNQVRKSIKGYLEK